jgi:surface protein
MPNFLTFNSSSSLLKKSSRIFISLSLVLILALSLISCNKDEDVSKTNDQLTSTFITTWKTDNPGTSNNDQITIPAIGTYNIQWEEVGNSVNVGSINNAKDAITITFPNFGTYKVKITGNLEAIKFSKNNDDKKKILSLEQWGNIKWKGMDKAFVGCANLVYNATDAPDLSGVTSLRGTFESCASFNGNIGNWDVSKINDMNGLFNNASSFNQDISRWDVSNVEDMDFMFRRATAFNQDISGWNVSRVSGMEMMFGSAISFNQDISKWDVSNVNDMLYMFDHAASFNQDISRWNVSNVDEMESMFENAISFNQDLGSWNISGVKDMEKMLTNTGLSTSNYDKTLSGWANQNVNTGIKLGAEGQKYCNSTDSRKTLVDNKGWTIVGDVNDCL